MAVHTKNHSVCCKPTDRIFCPMANHIVKMSARGIFIFKNENAIQYSRKFGSGQAAIWSKYPLRLANNVAILPNLGVYIDAMPQIVIIP